MRAGAVAIALALSVLWVGAAAAQGAAADAEAHVFSSFSSRADHAVLADNVRLGPALRRELGTDAGGRKVYDALLERITGRFFRVDAVRPGDVAQYSSLAGGDVSDPLVLLEAGEVLVLMQYLPKQRHVAFVEQLRGPAGGTRPAPKPQVDAPQLPPQVAQPPEIVQVPLPAEPPRAVPVVSKPAPVVSKPAPVVAKPAPVAAKPAPVAAKPAPVIPKTTTTPPAPAPVATPKVQAECVIKPVMSDDDLRACGAMR